VFDDPADPTEWITRCGRRDVDLIVLAGYLKLVPAQVVSRYGGCMLNIHPALLPLHGGRGMYGRRVHQAVLDSGARETGATVHLIDEEYDRGTVLAQSRVAVLAGDTPETLAARVLETEHKLLPAVVIAASRAGCPVPLADTLTELES
jgi:folate-dependent phosphoribosylglycinamide formyltransferase PurN